MTVSVTLNNLANLQNETTAVNTLNTNNAAITTGFASCVNVTGDLLQGNLDLNGNQILNLPSPATVNSPARLIDVTSNPTITVPPVGTSGGVVPLLNASNTFSATQTFNNVHVTGTTTLASYPSYPAGPTDTVKGTIDGVNNIDVNATQLTALISNFGASASGSVPASGGGSSKFLRADGNWAQTPYTHLETLSATSSAALQSTVSWSGYSAIEIHMFQLIPTGTGVTGFIQVHSAGIYQNTNYTGVMYTPNGTAIVSVSPTTGIQLTGTTAQVSTGPGISGFVRIYQPNSAVIHSVTTNCTYNATSAAVVPVTGGQAYNVASTIDGMQMVFSSGNISSGFIEVYGIL